jgi:surfactin synthase thioesterase subunit
VSTRDGVVIFERGGVQVQVVTHAILRAQFSVELDAFDPEIVLLSTDDPAQLLLEPALRAPRARVVYLARATMALPFGPDCAFPSETKTARLRAADRIVGVSQYVADYIRRHTGIEAVHVPISLLEPGEWPFLGSFDNPFVTLVNPCAVKGIAIFLALAEAFPQTQFVAVPTWGTNEQDRASLRERPNVKLLDPFDDVDQLFRQTKVLLAPSLWAEARSRIVVEAMLRGVPVMAADVGGIPEAKMGVPYLLPVNSIRKYQTTVDQQMVPVAEVPPQDTGPWRDALARLLTDRPHYEEVARLSRSAALQYAENLRVEPFERLLVETQKESARPAGVAADAGKGSLSPERRRLLALRLRQKAPASAWFPGADAADGPRLFCFPHAGGGAHGKLSGKLARWTICPVRLPGRESRSAEAPFERMPPLVEALARAIHPYLSPRFAFFGHSMGAAVAFELARLLRRRGDPLPEILIASAARAPQYRRNHVPPRPPDSERLLSEVRRLGGIPGSVLDDPAAMRTLLPAVEADSNLYRNYVYSEDVPLEIPIRAYGGADDSNIRIEHLEAWRAQTCRSFAIRLFPGGHFYLQTCPDEFHSALDEDLNQLG